jgi:hypothetical protein
VGGGKMAAAAFRASSKITPLGRLNSAVTRLIKDVDCAASIALAQCMPGRDELVCQRDFAPKKQRRAYGRGQQQPQQNAAPG